MPLNQTKPNQTKPNSLSVCLSVSFSIYIQGAYNKFPEFFRMGI